MKGCFVTTFERSKLIAEGQIPDPQPPSFVYRLVGDKLVDIESADREIPYEILFETDADNLSISTMVLNAILSVIF